MATKIFPDTTKQRFAWPGGYSIRYLDETPCSKGRGGGCGDVLCAACASTEQRDYPEAVFTPFVHWEGPADYCAVCNEYLPSEYGDPDAEEL